LVFFCAAARARWSFLPRIVASRSAISSSSRSTEASPFSSALRCASDSSTSTAPFGAGVQPPQFPAHVVHLGELGAQPLVQLLVLVAVLVRTERRRDLAAVLAPRLVFAQVRR